MRLTRSLIVAAVAALALSACGSSDGEASSEDGALETVTAGKLTIATGEPAYPPYVENDAPEAGEGFEAALAYAIAEELGFAKDDVVWTRTGFEEAIQPGPKDFDLNLQQFSITEERQKAVDFSSSYYSAPTAILAIDGGPGADAKSLADLRDLSIGVQTGTSTFKSLETIVKPSKDPQVFNSNDDAVAAFRSGQVDLLAVDLPTASFLTLGSEVGGVDDSVIVGQLDDESGSEWGALLDKDSPITDAVTKAIDTLRENGTLDELIEKWLPFASTPVLK